MVLVNKIVKGYSTGESLLAQNRQARLEGGSQRTLVTHPPCILQVAISSSCCNLSPFFVPTILSIFYQFLNYLLFSLPLHSLQAHSFYLSNQKSEYELDQHSLALSGIHPSNPRRS